MRGRTWAWMGLLVLCALVLRGCDETGGIALPDTDPSPTVAVMKGGPADASAGAAVTYVITTRNTGPITLVDVVVRDQLAPGAQLVNASRGGIEANGVVEWPPTAISVGQTIVDSVTVRFDGRGLKRDSASAEVSGVRVVTGASTVVRTPSFSELRDLIRSLPCDSFPEPGFVVTDALTGGPTYENEIHDCQRLVLGNGTFGPMVGIFPLDGAMRADFEEGPVATLFNYSVFFDNAFQAYHPLEIVSEWSCLWMKTPDHGVTWRAGIVPADTVCAASSREPTTFDSLAVAVQTHEAGPDVIPKTGRWQWDEDLGEHYIGIRCGASWCSVGSNQFTLDVSQPRVWTDAPHRVIPGYYDEQHLGILEGGQLRPGPWGRIQPSDDLGVVDFAEIETGVTVAKISLDATSASIADLKLYRAKLGLDTNHRGDLWLSIGTDAAEYRNASGDIADADLTFIELANHGATGSVRWRWRETDETPWVACIFGCCSVDEGRRRGA